MMAPMEGDLSFRTSLTDKAQVLRVDGGVMLKAHLDAGIFVVDRA